MHTIKISLTMFVYVVVALFTISGCGSAPARAIPTSLPAPAHTATVPPAAIPDGIYAIDTYKLKFQGGHFTLLTEFDQEWAQGHFVVNGNQITFTEEDFAPECGPEDSTYTYQWILDGKALTFSNPVDKCEGRPAFLMETPWVLKGQAQ